MDDNTPLGQAATLLRRLLAAVEAGEVDATTPNARSLLRRLEGAAIALELAAGDHSEDGDSTP